MAQLIPCFCCLHTVSAWLFVSCQTWVILMQNFFSSINRYVLKAISNQVSNVILHFFFWFCFSLHCNCSWKVVPISQPIQCKNVFFFNIFFSDEWLRLKANFLSSTQNDKTKLSFYTPLPFRTDAKSQFL